MHHHYTYQTPSMYQLSEQSGEVQEELAVPVPVPVWDLMAVQDSNLASEQSPDCLVA
jgi:hypothetical protein